MSNSIVLNIIYGVIIIIFIIVIVCSKNKCKNNNENKAVPQYLKNLEDIEYEECLDPQNRHLGSNIYFGTLDDDE